MGKERRLRQKARRIREGIGGRERNGVNMTGVIASERYYLMLERYLVAKTEA